MTCDCDAPDSYYGPHREWCAIHGEEPEEPFPRDEEEWRDIYGDEEEP